MTFNDLRNLSICQLLLKLKFHHSYSTTSQWWASSIRFTRSINKNMYVCVTWECCYSWTKQQFEFFKIVVPTSNISIMWKNHMDSDYLKIAAPFCFHWDTKRPNHDNNNNNQNNWQASFKQTNKQHTHSIIHSSIHLTKKKNVCMCWA